VSRLVIVSNRVSDPNSAGSSGGLAVGVADALRASGGMWFGWSGEVHEGKALNDGHSERRGNIQLVTVPLSPRDYEAYYLGFSNRVLWPVFHYRLDLLEVEPSFLEGYRRVNARFASELAGLLQSDDQIWVHDYHLIPLGAELRNLGIRQPIGFFLHIPFPARSVFVATPQHQWLTRSLFAYDLVGFQTTWDLRNFQRHVMEEEGGRLDETGVLHAFGNALSIGAFPIGIDVAAFRRMAVSKHALERMATLRQRTLARVNIIGVDRLDYSKGLFERFRAFRRLLELYPENQKRVSLTQIAPPTREGVDTYVNIRQRLESLSGSINGAYADFDWTPLRYIHRTVARRTLAGLFRGSQVGLVTPLRDGMNLVAKEYVAAQDEADPGVLVLSRFAGAAEGMPEALIVNPYDIDSVANALQGAITMSRDERIRRHRALFERISKHDVTTWRTSFLAALDNAAVAR